MVYNYNFAIIFCAVKGQDNVRISDLYNIVNPPQNLFQSFRLLRYKNMI